MEKTMVYDAVNSGYILMHKRMPVAKLEMDVNSGHIKKVISMFASEHIPIGVPVKNALPDRKALNDWWTDRSIPISRSGIRKALDTLGVTDTKTLLTRCYGLSLSDQYWICPEDCRLTWDDVNFFNNGFSGDIGKILFGSEMKPASFNFSSPDNTSDGNLIKRWEVIDGKYCLVKGGSNPYRQQPFNEVVATEIMKRIGIACVPYSITWRKEAPYSVCEDFVDENTDLVPAWRIIQTRKKTNSISLYKHFVTCAEQLGISDVVPFLDRMIVLDYIIANEDRHLNNFGALRNAENLDWIGMAPIYDSGSSLGYDKIPEAMGKKDEVVCKPFKAHHEEQLKLVSSLDWIDFSALSDIDKIITDIFSDDRIQDYMDKKRIDTIVRLTNQRINNLKEMASGGRSTFSISTADEVRDDIAAKYS